MILPPYPFSLEDPSDMSLEDRGTRALSCSSSAFCALKTEGPPRIPAGRVAPMTWKQLLCFSALLRSSSCRPQGPWIVPPPSCTSRPLLLSCTSLPANLCLAGCHSIPVSCKATLLLPFLTSHGCGTSRPARFSMGSQMQPLWMAVGGATSTRSTHGCGSLGAGGLAWGVYLCLRLRRGARRSSGLGRRGVKRPAAAARQLGAEMNETHGPSTSGGISQDIPGYASL